MIDKKSYHLLSYLLRLSNPETVTTISKALNQSRRKIYYYLDKINDELPSDVAKITPYPRIGIILNDEQYQACSKIMAELDGASYLLSIDERIELILIYIAVSKERVTIDKLIELVDVSRNTILNDLNTIRHHLFEQFRDIKLCVSKAQGYYFDCRPIAKIQFLRRLLHEIYLKGNRQFIAIVQKCVTDLPQSSILFSNNLKNYLYQELSTIEKSLYKKLNHKDLEFMIDTLPYLLLSYRSIEFKAEEKDMMNHEFTLVWERLEYQIAIHIARELQERFGLSLDTIEMDLIAMLLLSCRKAVDHHLESIDFDDLRQTLQLFLKTMQIKSQLSFKHEEDLLNQLLRHCKALLYRKTYDIVLENPLTNDIKIKYNDLFTIVKKHVFLLEEAWLIELTDDDIAYIVAHLGSEINNSDSEMSQKKHVVLVCDESIGLRKLFVAQCEKYLKQCEIDAIFTVEQFYSVSDILSSDMVITTNDSVETDLPMLVVNTILTEADIVNILYFLVTNEKKNDSYQNSSNVIKVSSLKI